VRSAVVRPPGTREDEGVLLATLIVGGVTAYWFGLRAGAWAAGATLALCMLATMVPGLATPIYLVLACGLAAVCVVGPRRERPPDAARAVRLLKTAIAQARSRFRKDRRDGTNGHSR
jgi:hypothetical protein